MHLIKTTTCELVGGEFLLDQIVLNFLNLQIIPLEDIKNYSSISKICVFSKRISIIIEPM